MKLIVATLFAITLTSCGSTWWQTVADNPAVAATSLEQQVHMFLSAANLVYEAVSPLLPSEKKPALDADYQKAVVVINHALSALDDAVAAAADAKQDKPDLSKEIGDIVAGADQLASVLSALKATEPPIASDTHPHPVLATAIPDLAQRHKAIRRHKPHAASAAAPAPTVVVIPAAAPAP
jgi:hypothetical protein